MRPASVILASVFAVALGGCPRGAQHGRVLPGVLDDPWVTVEAGNVMFGGWGMRAHYAVDRATQTCWLTISDNVAPMDCCAARRVPALRDVVTWESDATCSRVQPGLQSQPPAAPAPNAGAAQTR